jgi:hypothetical protein
LPWQPDNELRGERAAALPALFPRLPPLFARPGATVSLTFPRFTLAENIIIIVHTCLRSASINCFHPTGYTSFSVWLELQGVTFKKLFSHYDVFIYI